MNKYIRTNNSIYKSDKYPITKIIKIYEYEPSDNKDIKDGDNVIYVNGVREKVIKKSDTIEELCDEVVCEQTHTLMRPYFKKHDDEGFPAETHHEGIVNAIREGQFNAKNYDWFGAIWTTGDKGEPILKSVTKLKGILPNGEIDWELI